MISLIVISIRMSNALATDRSPPDEEFRDLLRASEKHDLPVLASGWFYTLGRDETLFEQNIHKGRLLGSRVHNVQVMTNHADGHVLTDQEVADFYMRAHDFGMRHGVVSGKALGGQLSRRRMAAARANP